MHSSRRAADLTCCDSFRSETADLRGRTDDVCVLNNKRARMENRGYPPSSTNHPWKWLSSFSLFSRRTLDPNVTPSGLYAGRGPAVCDGQTSSARGGLRRLFKSDLAELCVERRVKGPSCGPMSQHGWSRPEDRAPQTRQRTSVYWITPFVATSG